MWGKIKLLNSMLLRKKFKGYSNFQTSTFLRNQNSDSIEIFIDGKKLFVKPGITIIQAAAQAGVQIPRFCYHERLSIAGNCRMCLVEVEKNPKLVASCAVPVMPGQRIKTDSENVKKAREGMLEFLLANHPLDCPICDQGGECDLQDQSMLFGNDRSRFNEHSFTGKRAVEDKDIGPLIETVMTRCIQCTRCVRFACDVAGVNDLGTTGRGNDVQIGTYVEKMLESELSGNIIDLCPVGALTSKPTSFRLRPWELKKIESIDVMDATGSNIVIGCRSGEVMRIQPKINDAINEEWISDKARFSFDGLKNQRLIEPMIRVSNNSSLEKTTWENALFELSKKISTMKTDSIGAVVGPFADLETMVLLKDLMNLLNCENLFTVANYPPVGYDLRSNYLLNSSIVSIEESDCILLVGTCPRFEAPLINSRIRKSYINNNSVIGVIGPKMDLNYDYLHLGTTLEDLMDLIRKEDHFWKLLKKSKKPLIILGTNNFNSDESSTWIYDICQSMSTNLRNSSDKHWNVFNILHKEASTVGALDLGYKSINSQSISQFKLLYLFGVDSHLFDRKNLANDCFVIYQGHHGDIGAYSADIILPGCAYTEKNATYINNEGRPQKTNKAVDPPGNARQDWQIIRALSEFLRNPLNYDSLENVRSRMKDVCPHFVDYGHVQNSFDDLELSKLRNYMHGVDSKDPSKHLINSSLVDLSKYYMTDCITRSSPTMAKCVTVLNNQKSNSTSDVSTNKRRNINSSSSF